MKKEEIFKAIGEVDLPSVAYEKPQKNKFRINKIIAACAALAIAATGIFAVAKANTSGKNQCGGDIAFVPTISEIIYSGQPFPQSEIDEAIKRTGISMVAACDSKDAQIASKGFYLLSVTEKGNYMNFGVYVVPVITDGKVTSFLEIFRGLTGKLQVQHTIGISHDDMTKALSKDGTIAIALGDMWLMFITPENEIISYTGDASSIFSKSETEYIPREDYYSAYKTEYNTIN